MSATSEPLRRENAEPEEGMGPISPLLIALVGALGFFGIETMSDTDAPFGFGGDQRSAQAEAAATTLDGPGVFSARCAVCHQASGAGLPGAFPPLDGSEWVTGEPRTPVRILLRGIEGPITVAGAEYRGQMPSFADLSDQELADVLTYVRGSWSNGAEPVSVELVAEVRAEQAGKGGPWAGGEELAAARAESEER